MKKTDLQNLVQECIAEVLDEKRATTEGYDEFQRVDKGEKGVAAKDKGEEETYGAGYAAGKRAAKAKYKKLAEAYKALKEEGFGLDKNTPKDLNEEDLEEARFKKGEDIGKPGARFKKLAEAEAEAKTKLRITPDAQSLINIIEKQPIIIQRLSLINSREELESVFDYLLTKINSQLSTNTTGIRTAATNAAQKIKLKK